MTVKHAPSVQIPEDEPEQEMDGHEIKTLRK